MQPILPLILMALVLSGCGSLSGLNPASWFGGTDNTEPPAELVPLDNKINIKKLWSSTIGSGTGGYRVKLVPAITEDRVYAAASNGTVEAFDLFTGKSVWRVDVDIDISGATGAGDDLVLVGSANALLVGLRQETGEEVWRNTVSSEVLSVPKSDIGVAVVHTVDGKLFGFDAMTGKSLWVYDRTVPVLSLHGNSSPVISGISAIVGLANGKLASLDLISGDLRWEVSITAPSGRSELERMVDIDVDPLVVEGIIFACTYQGEMAAVTEDTGVVLWRRKLSSYSGIGGDWRQVYVSDDEGNLWAIDPSNGSAIWKNDTLLRRRLSGPALLGEYVVVGDFDGYLHWFDSNNGEMLARTRAGSDAISTQPIARDGVLYVYGEGGALTALTIEVPGELSDEPPEELSDEPPGWGAGSFPRIADPIPGILTMLPVIVLVGRPNVGKSTLFNRLTKSRDALVADQPGLTRDRQYGVGQLGSRPYILVDTGGISGIGDGVEALMERQVRSAIDEADHILFLLDAKEGLGGDDESIAEQLRRLGKSVTLVVNKSEGFGPGMAQAEFHALGLGEPLPIAAVDGHGVRSLIDRVLEDLPESSIDETDTERGTLIAVVGRPNVGKSTLVNRLLGEERVVTFDQPGTTRDSIFIPYRHNDKPYTLIDTAGMRRRARISEAVEKFSVIKTLQAVEQANVVLLVLDARQGIGEQDASIAGHILESGRALVIVVNKWDGLEQEQRDLIKDDLPRKLPFLDFAARSFVSALHGSGVGKLYQAVDEAFDSASRDLSTPELTRILESAVQEHQPPQVGGRRIKLRYAHQGGRNPPIIVIHGNQTDSVPAPYKRFLINRFRKVMDLKGTPVRLEFKSSNNPFKGKKNKLTERQVRKKQRLKKFVKRRGK